MIIGLLSNFWNCGLSSPTIEAEPLANSEPYTNMFNCSLSTKPAVDKLANL